MKIKTAELTGAALDWAVAKALGVNVGVAPAFTIGTFKKIAIPAIANNATPELAWPRVPYYSADWAQGGPIIEREKINLEPFDSIVYPASSGGGWASDAIWEGPTPLIAAMRCFVASKLGDEVEVPDDLSC